MSKRAVLCSKAKGWFIALAALALMLQVLTPPGFMLASSPAGPELVICTGHGPLVVADPHRHPAKAPKPGADAPCAFAVHGAAVPPPQRLAPLAVVFTPVAPAAAAAFDLAPGRGLAAPPPPSHGPPTTPI